MIDSSAVLAAAGRKKIPSLQFKQGSSLHSSSPLPCSGRSLDAFARTCDRYALNIKDVVVDKNDAVVGFHVSDPLLAPCAVFVPYACALPPRLPARGPRQIKYLGAAYLSLLLPLAKTKQLLEYVTSRTRDAWTCKPLLSAKTKNDEGNDILVGIWTSGGGFVGVATATAATCEQEEAMIIRPEAEQRRRERVMQRHLRRVPSLAADRVNQTLRIPGSAAEGADDSTSLYSCYYERFRAAFLPLLITKGFSFDKRLFTVESLKSATDGDVLFESAKSKSSVVGKRVLLPKIVFRCGCSPREVERAMYAMFCRDLNDNRFFVKTDNLLDELALHDVGRDEYVFVIAEED